MATATSKKPKTDPKKPEVVPDTAATAPKTPEVAKHPHWFARDHETPEGFASIGDTLLKHFNPEMSDAELIEALDAKDAKSLDGLWNLYLDLQTLSRRMGDFSLELPVELMRRTRRTPTLYKVGISASIWHHLIELEKQVRGEAIRSTFLLRSEDWWPTPQQWAFKGSAFGDYMLGEMRIEFLPPFAADVALPKFHDFDCLAESMVIRFTQNDTNYPEVFANLPGGGPAHWHAQ